MQSPSSCVCVCLYMSVDKITRTPLLQWLNVSATCTVGSWHRQHSSCSANDNTNMGIELASPEVCTT